MSEFIKYQHLERFGTTEVLNIELGTIHVFPKIDGTNASLWHDGFELKSGSRNRELSIEKDNGGFMAWAVEQFNFQDFFKDYPQLRLFGEWLIPHSLKTYRSEAWRKFYVFDVALVVDGELVYQSFDSYYEILNKYGIEYIPPIAKVDNCTYDKLIEYMKGNNYLIEDGKGAGEGIVIKNYNYKNKYGRNTFAKIVTSEFREKHIKEMGASYVNMKEPVEVDIVNEYVTLALVDKVYAKIENETGFTSRQIPQLLNTVYYDLVREDCWNFVKKHKNPNINFNTLQHLTYSKIKELRKDLF